MRKSSRPFSPRASRRAALMLAVCGLATGAAHAQTWTKVTNNAPAAVQLMLLLPDGSVMCSGQNGSTIGKTWYRLTPNSAGSYIAGTWTTLASSIDTRLYFSSQVLKDGRVFVAGGEYGTGGAKAEVYDSQTNTWTALPIPTSVLDPSVNSPVIGSAQIIFDANSEILPDGSVLIMPVGPKTAGIPIIYNPNTNAWSSAARLVRGNYQDEATWVKLPDQTILTIDPFGQFSERYNPVSATWINDGTVPVALYDSFGFEMGGGMMLPNGKAIYFGSTGNTALYTPTGTTSPGTWVAGPVIPGARGTPDAPCAALVTGNVLFNASPVPTSANHFPSPSSFFEYNYLTNTFTQVNGPTGATDPVATFGTAMLNLPDGSVLYSHFGADVYAYRPAGAAIPDGKPTITSITANGDGSYHMVGVKLNGITEGASYGDDLQMNSNYPLIRVTDSLGAVRYGRTFNWSHTGVSLPFAVSTEFRLPAGIAPGPFSLVVVANGFASDPYTSPAVSSGPASVSSCAGQTAQFTVAASGGPTLSYQWRRGTTNLSNSGEFSGVNTPTLTISPVGASDAGTDYNCVVTNVLGTATSGNATLALCYANCDCSTGAPVLSATDFACFLTKFRAGDPYANCDGSTDVPTLSATDFACFLNAFRAGCP